MNKNRRNELTAVLAKIEEIRNELESIMNDEEEYRDNMPENLQGSERFEQSDNACSEMQIALDGLDEVFLNIESAQE